MNEPIAWMHTNSKQIFKTEKPNEFDLPLFTPLYTYPMRELNEPIAYCVDLEEDALIEASKILCLDSTDENFLKIPLYTHPMRELTDEEIVKVLDDIVGDVQHIEVLHMIIFAKEILKASRGEK